MLCNLNILSSMVFTIGLTVTCSVWLDCSNIPSLLS